MLNPTASKRLTKVAAKKIVAAKQQRKRFVTSVVAVKPTSESNDQAGQLVTKVRAAKSAAFLDQYRRLATSA
jgi:hypothetical protein